MALEWSLSEAARLLGQPQHRLIYLCEKSVVLPDLGDARGRGSSRRFSPRNLLEFAIALSLRELTVPVSSVAAIIYALRAFEKKVQREIPGFRLASGLRKASSPDLRIILTDEGRLYFTLGSAGAKPKVYGGLDFTSLASSARTRRRSKRKKERTPSVGTVVLNSGLEGDARAWVEVSVTRIAMDLALDE